MNFVRAHHCRLGRACFGMDQLFLEATCRSLRFGYQRAWWQTLGGAEWDQDNSALRIIIARENKASWLVSRLCFSKNWLAASAAFDWVHGSLRLSGRPRAEALDEFKALFAFLREDPNWEHIL